MAVVTILVEPEKELCCLEIDQVLLLFFIYVVTGSKMK